MEDFIKKIFDIDENAENYQKKLEASKQELLSKRKNTLTSIDEEYLSVLNEEKENLRLRLNSIEEEDIKKLSDYRDKSKEIKNIFKKKKEDLIKKFSNALLESGEFYGE